MIVNSRQSVLVRQAHRRRTGRHKTRGPANATDTELSVEVMQGNLCFEISRHCTQRRALFDTRMGVC